MTERDSDARSSNRSPSQLLTPLQPVLAQMRKHTVTVVMCAHYSVHRHAEIDLALRVAFQRTVRAPLILFE